MLQTCLPIFSCILISTLGYLYLTSKYNALFKVFYVKSVKSTSNAILMGGVPLSLGLISGIATLLYINPMSFNSTVQSILFSFLASSFTLLLGGWFDDKFELRARYKLAFQFSAVGFYAFQVSQLANHKIETFLFLTFIGMALTNGSNLLDGLDTMIIKLKGSIFFSFFVLGQYFTLPSLSIFSILGISALVSFYPFNRYPSKVHQGEIGSSYLGFFTLFLFTIAVFERPMHLGSAFSREILGSAIVCIAFPILELGISFGRRLLMKKSPFKGDRLHLHHILRSKYDWSSRRTTTFMGLFNITCTLCALIMVKNHHALYAVLFQYATITLSYLAITYHVWKRAYEQGSLSKVFLSFNLEQVEVIDINNIEHFNLTTHEKEVSTLKAS